MPEAGARLDDELLLAGGVQPLGNGEAAIYKPRWGAFYRTPLEQHLRERKVTTLVFCGCNFPNCPRTSIYEASERDFRVVVAADAVSGLYERGERELENIGVRLMSSDDLVEAMRAAHGGQGTRGVPAGAPSPSGCCAGWSPVTGAPARASRPRAARAGGTARTSARRASPTAA